MRTQLQNRLLTSHQRNILCIRRVYGNTYENQIIINIHLRYIILYHIHTCIHTYIYIHTQYLSPADHSIVVQISGATFLLEELPLVFTLRRQGCILYRAIAIVAVQCYQHGRVHLPHVAVSMEEYRSNAYNGV